MISIRRKGLTFEYLSNIGFQVIYFTPYGIVIGRIWILRKNKYDKSVLYQIASATAYAKAVGHNLFVTVEEYGGINELFQLNFVQIAREMIDYFMTQRAEPDINMMEQTEDSKENIVLPTNTMTCRELKPVQPRFMTLMQDAKREILYLQPSGICACRIKTITAKNDGSDAQLEMEIQNIPNVYKVEGYRIYLIPSYVCGAPRLRYIHWQTLLPDMYKAFMSVRKNEKYMQFLMRHCADTPSE